MDQVREYRAVLAADIEDSSGRGDEALRAIREALTLALTEAVRSSDVEWERCVREDLGDGWRIIAPAGVDRARFVHPLARELDERLRAHNRLAGAPARVRVRVAVHAGDVMFGPDGAPSGGTLEVVARMLDSAVLREALAAAPADTAAAMVVSQHVYEESVRHGFPGIDPETFRPVTISAKRYSAPGWLFVPGMKGAEQPEPSEPSGPSAPPAPSAAAGSVMYVQATQKGRAIGVQHGTITIHGDGKG